jgi:hypothetical protein
MIKAHVESTANKEGMRPTLATRPLATVGIFYKLGDRMKRKSKKPIFHKIITTIFNLKALQAAGVK